MNLNQIIELLAVYICSITGAMSPMRKDIDGFGIIVVAAVTGIGGGTLRDILLGRFPVFWMVFNEYFIAIFLGAITAMIFAKNLQKQIFMRLLLILDALSMGFFTIIGVEIGLAMKTTSFVAVLMGMITGIAGGMMRDVLCNEIPFVLRREIYAIASISGATFFVFFQPYIIDNYLMLVAISITVIIRVVSLHFHLTLPTFGSQYQKSNS